MATVDLRTLPISDQHHTLAFNQGSSTGRRASDFLWICPTCDDAVTYPPLMWSGGAGYVHYDGTDEHQLVAVDVIAVIEMYRQLACSSDDDGPLARMRVLGAPKEPSLHA
jgi:hypothetical protein